MGKANVWLKISYAVVISLIAIISLLLLGFTLFSHGHFHRREEAQHLIAGIHVLYTIAVVTIVFTVLGAFGAWKEKKWALIVFVVGMTLGSLFLFVGNIKGLVSLSRLHKDLKEQYLEMLPLANVSESTLEDLDLTYMQREWECCGLESYRDWNYNIPESCLCTEGSTNPCVAAPKNSILFNEKKDNLPVLIHEKGCLSYIIESTINLLKAVLGTMLGIILLWVLSVVLCIAILCQLDQKKDTPAVVYSAEAKAGNYTTLSEPPE